MDNNFRDKQITHCALQLINIYEISATFWNTLPWRKHRHRCALASATFFFWLQDQQFEHSLQKVKTSLCTPWRITRLLEVRLHSYLTSDLNSDELSVPCPGWFTLVGIVHGLNYTGGRVEEETVRTLGAGGKPRFSVGRTSMFSVPVNRHGNMSVPVDRHSNMSVPVDRHGNMSVPVVRHSKMSVPVDRHGNECTSRPAG